MMWPVVRLAEVRQQQKDSGKSFLTRIEQLIDQVCFDADGPAQKMRNEHFGECRFLVNHPDNSRLFQPRDDGVRHDRDRRDTLHLPSEASFAEELIRSKNGDDRFLALLGNDGELRLAFLNVEDRIARVALGKDDLALAVLADASAVPDTGEKRFCIECGSALGRHHMTFHNNHKLFWPVRKLPANCRTRWGGPYPSNGRRMTIIFRCRILVVSGDSPVTLLQIKHV